MADKRIIQLTEKQSIDSGDFLAVDNSIGGTKKIAASNLSQVGYTVSSTLGQVASTVTSGLFQCTFSVSVDGAAAVDYTVFSRRGELCEVFVANNKLPIYLGLDILITTSGGTTYLEGQKAVPSDMTVTATLTAVSLVTPSTTVKTATLAAGSTSVTFTNIPTTGNNTLDLYSDTAGVEFNELDDSTSGQLTYTFTAQESAVNLFLIIKEVS